jgi:hypothetical protein
MALPWWLLHNSNANEKKVEKAGRIKYLVSYAR